MAKVVKSKVTKRYYDINLEEIKEVDDILEVTEERLAELQGYVIEVKEDKKENKENKKEEVKEEKGGK